MQYTTLVLLLALVADVFGANSTNTTTGNRDGPFYWIDDVTPLGKVPIYKGNEKFLVNFEKIREENTWLKVPSFKLGEFGWGSAFYTTFRDYNCMYLGFEQTVTFNGTYTVTLDGSFRLMETDYTLGSVAGVAGDIIFEFNMQNWPFVKETNTLWTRLKIFLDDVVDEEAECKTKSGTNSKLFYNIQDGDDVHVLGYVDDLYSSAMQIDYRFPVFEESLKHMSILRIKTTCDVSASTWTYTDDDGIYGNRTDTTTDNSGSGSGSNGGGSSNVGEDNSTDTGDVSGDGNSTDPTNDSDSDQSSNGVLELSQVSLLAMCAAILLLLLF